MQLCVDVKSCTEGEAGLGPVVAIRRKHGVLASLGRCRNVTNTCEGIDVGWFLISLLQGGCREVTIPHLVRTRASTSAMNADGWHFNATASLKMILMVG